MTPSVPERAFTLTRTGAPLTLTASCPAVLCDLLTHHGLSEHAADSLAYRAWANGHAAFGLVTVEAQEVVARWDGGWP